MAAIECARHHPRRTQATPLYRLVKTHYEDVKAQWEEYCQGRYGFWRNFVDTQVRRYLGCGLFESGFASIRCPESHADYLLAISCKMRDLCLSCAGTGESSSSESTPIPPEPVNAVVVADDCGCEAPPHDDGFEAPLTRPTPQRYPRSVLRATACRHHHHHDIPVGAG